MQTPYKPIFKDIELAENKFLEVLNAFDPQQINAVPETDSWTAAQVAVHLSKSTGSIAGALHTIGNKAARQADKMVPALDVMFLNFDTKMNAPEFTRPAIQDYLKEDVITETEMAYQQTIEAGLQADLTELFTLPGLGELTKYELLHFILVHTKRHTHQLEKVAAKVMH
jgi:hypothetical protein